jgi:hypothetical protein
MQLSSYLRPTAALAASLLLSLTSWAQSKVAVSSGYNDEPREGGSFSGIAYSADSGQPVPWIQSAATSFFGNSATAMAFDPDEDAILLVNDGTSPISLTDATIGAFDLFSLDGITGPVTLNPGWNYILAGVDGSDTFGSPQSIGVTLGGTLYSYTDVVTSQAPNGVLAGADPFIGGAESMPWTAVYTPSSSNTVPDTASTGVLAGIALAGLAALRRKLAR